MSDQIELIMDLRSADLARAFSHAVEPDNRIAPEGVAITTHQEGTRLITIIDCKQRPQTLLATFNDLVETLTTLINVLEGL